MCCNINEPPLIALNFNKRAYVAIVSENKAANYYVSGVHCWRKITPGVINDAPSSIQKENDHYSFGLFRN